MFVLSDPAHQMLSDRLEHTFTNGSVLSVGVQGWPFRPSGMILNGYLTSPTNLCIPGYSDGSLPCHKFCN